MKDPYAMSIEIIIALSRIYLRRIIMSVFTIITSVFNIQSLAVELFKVKKNLSNTIMSDIFPTRVLLNYNLRSQTDFIRNTVNTIKFGLNTSRHFASKVWSMLPIEMKNSLTVEIFKSKISKWEPNDCDCKRCQDYLHGIGYVKLFDV